MNQTTLSIASLAAAALLAGCSGYQAEYTKLYSEVSEQERSQAFGEAIVRCVVVEGGTFGRCAVVSASPDTAEVRDAALQGIHMRGLTPDEKRRIPVGGVVERRVVTAGYY